jgi:hypothetical protein
LRRIDKPGFGDHLRDVSVDEGGNPVKVGSLFGDKPISSLFDTLRYRSQGLFPSGKGSSSSTQEEEAVKAASEAKRENTLKGTKPRRASTAPSG